MAEAPRLSGDVPSPQLTLKELIVPSGSVAENVTVTSWPVVAGLGDTLLIVTTGGRSLTMADVVLDPVSPASSLADTVIVKVMLVAEPVEE